MSQLALLRQALDAQSAILKSTPEQLKDLIKNTKSTTVRKLLPLFRQKLGIYKVKMAVTELIQKKIETIKSLAPVIKEVHKTIEDVYKTFTKEDIQEINEYIFGKPIIIPQPKGLKKLAEEAVPKLEEELNAYAPVYVIASSFITTDSNQNELLYRDSNGFTLLEDPSQADTYITEFVKNHPYDAQVHLVSSIIFEFKEVENDEPLPILRVANLECENCVINLIKRITNDPLKISKIYKTYPTLDPSHEDNKYKRSIFMTHNQLNQIGKSLNLEFRIYTPIGLKLNQPWHILGDIHNHRKTIPVKIQEEHATLADSRLKIDNIHYYENNNELYQLPQDTYILNFTQNYYTLLNNDNTLTLHKSYRPSSFTNNPDDDSNLELAYYTSEEQMISRQFKLDHNLHTIRDPTIKRIIISAEHFIGKRQISPMDLPLDQYRQYDSNANYACYETNSYYRGFPSHVLIPCKKKFSTNPAFYVLKNIYNPPLEFQHLYQYTQGPITIPAPTYDYLVDSKCSIQVDYVLDTPDFQKISILDYAEKYYPIKTHPDQNKKFRNENLGRLISGGLKETDKTQIPYKNINERDQMIKECQANHISFDFNDTHLTIQTAAKNSGIFQFHSYILSYAAINVMKKFRELTKLGKSVVAYCVDALVVQTTVECYNDRIPGNWKIEYAKPYFQALSLSPITQPDRANIPLTLPNKPHYLRNTLILGPGGIGKSYPFLTAPYHSQMVTTPTKLLKAAHKKLHQNTTLDKYKILRQQNKLPTFETYTIADEITMFDKEQWQIILDRSADHTIIIGIGDFNQIRTDNNKKGYVDLSFFQDNNFDIIYMERDPEKICRHEYYHGKFLDTLRDKTYKEQMLLLHNYFPAINPNEIIDFLTPNAHIIVGTHTRAHYFHTLLRPLLKTIKVRSIKNPEFIYHTDINNPLIYWDRTSMLSTPHKKYKYEPHLAITADSFQGQTSEEAIIVDAKSLTRHGTLYTAVTRTREYEDTYIVS